MYASLFSEIDDGGPFDCWIERSESDPDRIWIRWSGGPTLRLSVDDASSLNLALSLVLADYPAF